MGVVKTSVVLSFFPSYTVIDYVSHVKSAKSCLVFHAYGFSQGQTLESSVFYELVNANHKHPSKLSRHMSTIFIAVPF